MGEPFTETRQKNPAVAFNHQGDRLIAWGESVSHSRGGRLNLRIYTAGGVETDFPLAEQVQIANFSFLRSQRFQTAIFWCFTEDWVAQVDFSCCSVRHTFSICSLRHRSAVSARRRSWLSAKSLKDCCVGFRLGRVRQ